MILVVAEQREGKLNPASWEVISAAQQIREPEATIKIALAGSAVGGLVDELAEAEVAEVLFLEDPALGTYTPDGFVQAFAELVEKERPDLVLFSHTYQTRDYAPALATHLGRVLISDCIAFKRQDEGLLFVRPMFQGKFVADVRAEGPSPQFVSFQIGSYHAEAVRRGASRASTRSLQITIDASAVREQPETPFKEAKQAVDLTKADRIVAVGRGIKAQEHLPLAQELAKALDAELAASRPICDAEWLPMDRQIGSSGQTVAPKLYLALGISGAIQHVVGMKGARTIVAINKDGDAPIFEISDYGIIGDLFEIVPALISELGE